MKKKVLLVFAILLVTATAFAGCSDDKPVPPLTYSEVSDSLSDNGYLGDPDHGTESAQASIPVEVENASFLVMVTAVLTWVDDEASDGSEPDMFKLSITNGEMSRMANSDQGRLEVSLEVDENSTGGSMESASLGNKVDVIVDCVECGFTPDIKDWGAIHLGHNDPGNDYSLEIKYDYLEPDQ